MTDSRDEQDIFTVERHEAGGVRNLLLSGVIDEFSDLAFFAHLQGEVVVHMGEVRRINSFGVRLWIDAVRSVPADAQVVYVQVPTPIVEQMNLVNGFFGRGRVESFLAPMVCTGCGHDQAMLFEVSECTKSTPPGLPPTPCPSCGLELMELDDIEEQYLAFLKDF